MMSPDEKREDDLVTQETAVHPSPSLRARAHRTDLALDAVELRRHSPAEKRGVHLQGGACHVRWPEWKLKNTQATRQLNLVGLDGSSRRLYVPACETRQQIEARLTEHMALHQRWLHYEWNDGAIRILPSDFFPVQVRSKLCALFDLLGNFRLRAHKRMATLPVRSMSAGHRATHGRGILKCPSIYGMLEVESTSSFALWSPR
eukprot:5998952-Amphidinium_carterae.1